MESLEMLCATENTKEGAVMNEEVKNVSVQNAESETTAVTDVDVKATEPTIAVEVVTEASTDGVITPEASTKPSVSDILSRIHARHDVVEAEKAKAAEVDKLEAAKKGIIGHAMFKVSEEAVWLKPFLDEDLNALLAMPDVEKVLREEHGMSVYFGCFNKDDALIEVNRGIIKLAVINSRENARFAHTIVVYNGAPSMLRYHLQNESKLRSVRWDYASLNKIIGIAGLEFNCSFGSEEVFDLRAKSAREDDVFAVNSSENDREMIYAAVEPGRVTLYAEGVITPLKKFKLTRV